MQRIYAVAPLYVTHEIDTSTAIRLTQEEARADAVRRPGQKAPPILRRLDLHWFRNPEDQYLARTVALDLMFHRRSLEFYDALETVLTQPGWRRDDIPSRERVLYLGGAVSRQIRRLRRERDRTFPSTRADDRVIPIVPQRLGTPPRPPADAAPAPVRVLLGEAPKPRRRRRESPPRTVPLTDREGELHHDVKAVLAPTSGSWDPLEGILECEEDDTERKRFNRYRETLAEIDAVLDARELALLNAMREQVAESEEGLRSELEPSPTEIGRRLGWNCRQTMSVWQQLQRKARRNEAKM